ncbi:hypothetical protein N665_0070s0042 [Sinapis alba]|nr:hypothetical protein N665_0070s0042 [Sinapis alba]
MVHRPTSVKIAEVITSLPNFPGTHLRTILHQTDFNPEATSRIDVDVASMALLTARRQRTPKEEEGMCTICHEELIGAEYVNSLQCTHIFHHNCIVDWIPNNLSCSTCRDARF